jgi:DNA (cytosine-5)-methyltransferase 1
MVRRYEDVQREAEATVKSWLTVYFNELDKYPAQWLRNLFPDSTVDDRSIKDVRPTDTDNYLRCHFFAGIGGWEYALQLAGWPADREVWTGSCPCQPFSQAGKRKGTADERHLWPDFLRLIAERLPATIFGEQVASPDGREWLAGVRVDLEALGYAFGAADLCAAGAGAPHIRQRLYWVANRNSARAGVSTGRGRRSQSSEHSGLGDGDGSGRVWADAHIHQRQSQQDCIVPAGASETHRLGEPNRSGSQGRQAIIECPYQWPPGQTSLAIWCDDGLYRRIEPGTLPLAHGISNRLGRIRAYGNAIVPQVAAKFIRAFLETE